MVGAADATSPSEREDPHDDSLPRRLPRSPFISGYRVGCAGDARDDPMRWTVGDGDPEAFVAALGEIQEAASLPCEYAIPLPPPGEVLDLDLVNVTFSDPDLEGGLVFRVDDESDCDSERAAWYYDDPLRPSSIQLCEATCNYVMAGGAAARLDVAYGCQTIVIPE